MNSPRPRAGSDDDTGRWQEDQEGGQNDRGGSAGMSATRLDPRKEGCFGKRDTKDARGYCGPECRVAASEGSIPELAESGGTASIDKAQQNVAGSQRHH